MQPEGYTVPPVLAVVLYTRGISRIVHRPDRISVPKILSNLTAFFQEIYACIDEFM